MDPDRLAVAAPSPAEGGVGGESSSASSSAGGIVRGYFPRDRYKGPISAPLSCSPSSSLVAAAAAAAAGRSRGGSTAREAGSASASSSAGDRSRRRRAAAAAHPDESVGGVASEAAATSPFLDGSEGGDLASTAAERRLRLDEASEALVGRLVRFVDAVDGRRREETRRGGGRGGGRAGEKKRGLTLPASAIGWLSSEIFPDDGGEGDGHTDGGRMHSAGSSPRMQERLAKLRQRLPRSVEYLKVTNEEWPPPPPPSEQQDQNGGGAPSSSKIRQRRRGSNLPSGDRSVTSTASMFSMSFPRGVLAYYYPESKTDRGGAVSPLEGTVILSGPGVTSSSQDTETEEFLSYWHRIRYNPRINMELFLSANVLILDGVLPKWVTNLKLVREGLKLMRVERGSLWDLNIFLFPDDETSSGLEKVPAAHGSGTEAGAPEMDGSSRSFGDGDGVFVSIPNRNSPLDKDETSLEANEAGQFYSALSHLKLSHCAIGEISGLSGVLAASPTEGFESIDHMSEQGLKRRRPRSPPLSRMPNLESLCLSHNEIVLASTACAGLVTLPKLSALDLSHNYISTMNDAFLMLGNIRTLILSGNRITSTRGLDRMYCLERLSLNDNRIEKLQDMAGLADLPELAFLDLKGNPLERASPEKCRVQVLNLFRETRFVFLPKGATYRQLLGLLPVLDGEAATKKELLALKDLTFLPSLNPMDEPISVAANGSSQNRDQDSLLESDANETAGAETDLSRRPDPSQPFLTAKMPAGSQRHVIKVAPTRMANIREMGASGKRRRKKNAKKRKAPRQKMAKAVHSTGLSLSDESLGDEVVDLTSITIKEVVAALIPCDQWDDDSISLDDPNADDEVPSPRSNDDSNAPTSTEQLYLSEEKQESSRTNLDSGSTGELAPDEDGSVVSEKGLPKDTDNSRDPDNRPNDNDAVGSPSFEIPDITEEINKGDTNEDFDADNEVQSKQECEFSLTEDPVPATSLPNPPIRESQSSAGESSEGSKDPKRDSFRGAQFPDIWDDVDVPSSLALGQSSEERKENSALSKPQYNFGEAERTASYDGPENYGVLPIASHLDLYFQSFVFPKTSDDDDYVSFEESSAEDIYSNFPRIQLFKSDRDTMMSGLAQHARSAMTMSIAATEKLVDVWKDDVLACGVPALSRLPSNQIPQRGFHGELVVLQGEEAQLAESKRKVFCLSNEALYIIPDTYSADEAKGEATQDRRFPSPIPRGARFEDACWPHAIVRHPLKYLRRITIGFQFQRLILHFSLPSNKAEDRKKLDFVYIIFTCNKMRSISLLQKIQAQPKEKATDTNSGESVLIDNDDRTILDALGVLSAPSFIGTVLHYQILLQKWKHGERETVRRACILTDAKMFLLDETYIGDGSSLSRFQKGKCGDIVLGPVDSAELMQVSEIRAADEDPRVITLVIKAPNRLQRSHRWRLVCKDGQNAERLIEDVRKAKRSL